MTQSQRTQVLPAPTLKAEPTAAAAASKKAELRGLPFEAQVEALKPKGPDGRPPAPASGKTGAGPTGVVMSGGEQMIAVQNALASKGYDVGPINGINAGRTKASIIEFQRANGLVPDGIVGPKTLSALGVDVSGMKASPGVGQLPKKEEQKTKGEPSDEEKQAQKDHDKWAVGSYLLGQRSVVLQSLLGQARHAESSEAREEVQFALQHHQCFNTLFASFVALEHAPAAEFLRCFQDALGESESSERWYVSSMRTEAIAKSKSAGS